MLYSHQVQEFKVLLSHQSVERAGSVLVLQVPHSSWLFPALFDRVADALDMSEGRSRIVYEMEKLDIYSVSAAAIDKVNINKGTEKPIQLDILMNNSAGIFQLDELLKKKIIGSGIEKYLDVHAYINQKTEKGLIKEYRI